MTMRSAYDGNEFRPRRPPPGEWSKPQEVGGERMSLSAYERFRQLRSKYETLMTRERELGKKLEAHGKSSKKVELRGEYLPLTRSLLIMERGARYVEDLIKDYELVNRAIEKVLKKYEALLPSEAGEEQLAVAEGEPPQERSSSDRAREQRRSQEREKRLRSIKQEAENYASQYGNDLIRNKVVKLEAPLKAKEGYYLRGQALDQAQRTALHWAVEEYYLKKIRKLPEEDIAAIKNMEHHTFVVDAPGRPAERRSEPPREAAPKQRSVKKAPAKKPAAEPAPAEKRRPRRWLPYSSQEERRRGTTDSEKPRPRVQIREISYRKAAEQLPASAGEEFEEKQPEEQQVEEPVVPQITAAPGTPEHLEQRANAVYERALRLQKKWSPTGTDAGDLERTVGLAAEFYGEDRVEAARLSTEWRESESARSFDQGRIRDRIQERIRGREDVLDRLESMIAGLELRGGVTPGTNTIAHPENLTFLDRIGEHTVLRNRAVELDRRAQAVGEGLGSGTPAFRAFSDAYVNKARELRGISLSTHDVNTYFAFRKQILDELEQIVREKEEKLRKPAAAPARVKELEKPAEKSAEKPKEAEKVPAKEPEKKKPAEKKRPAAKPVEGKAAAKRAEKPRETGRVLDVRAALEVLDKADPRKLIAEMDEGKRADLRTQFMAFQKEFQAKGSSALQQVADEMNGELEKMRTDPKLMRDMQKMMGMMGAVLTALAESQGKGISVKAEDLHLSDADAKRLMEGFADSFGRFFPKFINELMRSFGGLQKDGKEYGFDTKGGKIIVVSKEIKTEPTEKKPEAKPAKKPVPAKPEPKRETPEEEERKDKLDRFRRLFIGKDGVFLRRDLQAAGVTDLQFKDGEKYGEADFKLSGEKYALLISYSMVGTKEASNTFFLYKDEKGTPWEPKYFVATYELVAYLKEIAKKPAAKPAKEMDEEIERTKKSILSLQEHLRSLSRRMVLDGLQQIDLQRVKDDMHNMTPAGRRIFLDAMRNMIQGNVLLGFEAGEAKPDGSIVLYSEDKRFTLTLFPDGRVVAAYDRREVSGAKSLEGKPAAKKPEAKVEKKSSGRFDLKPETLADFIRSLREGTGKLEVHLTQGMDLS